VFNGNPYWLRDLTEKLARRVKKLVGRADPSPWVVRPHAPKAGDGADLMVTGADADSPLVRALHAACSPRRLTLMVAGDDAAGRIASGDLRPAVVLALDVSSAVDAARAAGAHVLGAFDATAAIAKAEAAGISFTAGAAQASLGVHSAGELVRVLHVVGDQTIVAWSPGRGTAAAVDWQAVRSRNLMSAAEQAERVARAASLECFAMDFAVLPQGRVVPVEFVADPWATLPDATRGWCAERIADVVDRRKRGAKDASGHSVWVPPATPPASAAARVTSVA
jgi:hypothetical protein